MEYPEEAGYPLGSNFSVQYYLLQMHYNNPRQLSSISITTEFLFSSMSSFEQIVEIVLVFDLFLEILYGPMMLAI